MAFVDINRAQTQQQLNLVHDRCFDSSLSKAFWLKALAIAVWAQFLSEQISLRLQWFSCFCCFGSFFAFTSKHKQCALHLSVLTSKLTAYLTPNTRLSTPRLRYCIPKINTFQLSRFRAPQLLLPPYKGLGLVPQGFASPSLMCHPHTHWHATPH